MATSSSSSSALKASRRCRVDVQHADQRAFDQQRDGQFAADVLAHGNVTRIGGDIRDAQRFAHLRHPARDAAADGELGLLRLLAQADGDFDLEQLRVRVDEHERAAGGLHDAHGLGENAIEDLLRFERGVDDAADARQHFKLAELAFLRRRGATCG